MNPQIEDCLSVDEIAAILDISPDSVRSHHLPKIKARCGFYKFGRKVHIPEKTFRAYLRDHYTPPSLNA